MRTRGRGKSRGMREKCRYGIEILKCADRKKSLEARFHPFPFNLPVCQKFHEDPWKKYTQKIHGKFVKRSKDMEGDQFRSMAIQFTEFTEIFQKDRTGQILETTMIQIILAGRQVWWPRKAVLRIRIRIHRIHIFWASWIRIRIY